MLYYEKRGDRMEDKMKQEFSEINKILEAVDCELALEYLI